jgi:PAS domain S-box-containing protein
MPRLSAVMIERVDTSGRPTLPPGARAEPKSYHRRALPSQWLAVEAGADPRARARELRRSWEFLVADGELPPEREARAVPGMRETIVESWRRSLASGLDPTNLLAPIEADESEMLERWFEHPLGSLTSVLIEQLRKVAEEARGIVVVTDASGLVMRRVGDEWLKERAAEMNLIEGARYSEAADGTNGIGTALAADHAFQVFGFEHFNERHHHWVCSGVPVHDPVSGQTVGLIDLSSVWTMAHPRSLELVTTAARTMEQCLAAARRDHDARLRRRYWDLANRTTDLLVSRDGYVLAGDGRPADPKRLAVPENGGEILLSDGSVAFAEPLGHGEAYLVRRIGPSGFGAAPTKALERAEGRAREQAVNVEASRPDTGSDGRASAYFEAALDCVIIADASGRVVEFNPAAERTFGYTRDEALGRTMAELIVPPSLRERHITAFARFIETRHGRMLGRRLELTGMRADGSEFPVELTLSQVKAEPVLICGALRDISVAKQAEGHLRELAEEQAALRRVATLVARASSPQQVFAVVAEQVARIINVPLVRLVRYESDGSQAELIGGWGESVDPLAIGTRWQLDGPGVLAFVWQSGRPARLDDYTDVLGQPAAVVRQAGMRSAVASPITVEGRLWGAMAVLSPRHEPLPENTEARLADFTELVATAIANAESRAAIARLADEQAALRRVATLVARGVRPVDVFSAVSKEVQRLFGLHGKTLDVATVVRFDPGAEFILVGAAKSIEGLPLGTRWGPKDLYVSTRVHRTGRSARVDEADLSSIGGPEAETLRRQGLISQVGSPINVEGRLWGTVTVNATEKLPPDTEERLEKFTELVATAIANAESRAELAASEARARKLAEEQAALRRVATLAARESSPVEVLEAVAAEAARVLEVDAIGLLRFEPDETATLVAQSETPWEPPPLGTSFTLEGENIVASVHRTGQAARMDDWESATGSVAAMANVLGVRSAVACPVVVEGGLWGTLVAATNQSNPLPADTESQIVEFTELLATAIGNSEARDGLRRFLDEQAALRRVATLVAASAAPSDVFAAVTAEIALVLDANATLLCRADPDGAAVVVGSWGDNTPRLGTRLPQGGRNLTTMVLDTGRPARIDSYVDATGDASEVARSHGLRSAVGAPILVEGRLWGLVIAGTTGDEALPPNAEERLAGFSELVATAISNATARAELVASRARIVAAGDEARRRIERDLHDGAQQQLVTLAVGLRATKERVPSDLEELQADLAHTADGLTAVLNDLREMSRGIHPAILTEGGLGPALKALARRSGIPVEIDLHCDRRLAEGIEVAAYYVVSEALTNAAKHAEASRVRIAVNLDEATLYLSIRDDGLGGADASRGSGLIGLRDRVEALGGTVDLASPPGSGTRLDVEIPLLAEPAVASDLEPLSRV